MAAKKCLICNYSFSGRADARTCSPRCRKRLQQVRSELGAPVKRRFAKAAVLLILGLFGFLSILFSSGAPRAIAATSSNLNFQARLLNSAGGIVPDGTYNIDFKIYNADSTTGSVGTCSGACLWEETRKNFASQGVQVINGYFSVNLGSVTSFPAINWDQQLWLTMNIGGTSAGASPTWDGEMQNSGHSIALTALPYSFVAGQLAKTSGANRGTLSFGTVANNPVIALPDASGTVCLQTASACGFAATTGGTGYIQNGTSLQSNANFNIQSASTTGLVGVLRGATGQTADILTLVSDSRGPYAIMINNSTFGGNNLTGFGLYQEDNGQGVLGTNNHQAIVIGTNGNVGIGTTTTTNPAALLTVSGAGSGSSLFRVTDTTATSKNVLDVADGGATTFQNQTDSTTAFQIQNSAGTSLLTADTTNSKIDINAASLSTNLDGHVVIEGTTTNLETKPFDPAASGYTDPGPSGIASWSSNAGTDMRGLSKASRYFTSSAFRINWKDWTGLTPSTNYTLSAYIKANGSFGRVGIGNGATYVTPTNNWTRISATGTSDGSGNLKFGFQTTSDATVDILVTQVQMEVSSAATSFVNGSRNAGDTVVGGKLNVIGGNGISTFGSGVLIQPAADTTTAFQIQNAAGTSNLFVADTTTGRIGIGKAAPAYKVDILATNDLVNIQSGAAGTYTGIRLGRTGEDGTLGIAGVSGNFFTNAVAGDITLRGNSQRVLIGTGNADASLIIDTDGSALFKNTTNSTTAFQIQNSTGASLLTADTTTSQVTINGDLIGGLSKQGAANLLSNSGFEASGGTSSSIPSWVISAGGGTTGVSSAFALSGANSAILSNSAAFCNSYIYQDVPVKQNTKYSISAYLKTVSEVGLSSVGISSTSFGSFVLGNTVTGTNGFTLSKLEGYDSGSNTSLRFFLTVQNCAPPNTGTTYFDNVMAVEGSSATAFSAKAITDSSSSTQTISGNLVVLSDSTTAFQVQNSSGNKYFLVNTTGASVSLGDTGIASTVQIGNTTGAVAQTINVGNNTTSGASTTVNIGAVGSSVAASTIHIGDTNSSTSAQAITIGSQANNTGDVTTVQGGSLTTGNGAIYLVTGTNGTNAGTITIGNTATARIQQINIGTNATASSQANISIGSSIGGTTAVTGPTTVTNRTSGASDTFNVSNSTSTGTIAKFSDNTTAVLTLADGGGATFENSSNSAVGFQIQNAAGSDLVNVNTTDGYVINNGIEGLDNQIQNAGFESSGTTDSTGWFTPSATQVLTNSSANAHTGNYELQITGNSTTHAVTTKWYAVHPGDQIYVEAWVKNSVAAPGDDGIYLEFADKDLGNSTFNNNDTGVPGTTYVLKSITTTVPSGKAYVRAAASTKSTATSGTFYFDDFYMKRINQQAPLLLTGVSTTAFQVQNAGGLTVLGVDSSGSKIFSTLADGSSAIGFTLSTPSYTASGAKLFSLQNNTTEKFAVDKDGNISATGGVSIATGQTYKINNTQITSAALSNDSDIAKLSGTGPQTFSGNNKFTGTVLSQTTSTTAFQVQNATNSILLVDASGNKTVLGTAGASGLTAKLQFNFSGSTGSISLVPLDPTSTAYTINLPAENGTICTSAASSTANCTNFASASSVTTGLAGKLNKGAVDTSSAAVVSGNLYAFTNSSSNVASGVLKLDNGNNTEAALLVTGTTDYASGKAYIVVNNTNGTPTGNLIDLQSNGVDQFTVDAVGAVSAAGNISIASGKTYQINGLQISSTALSDGSNLAKLNGTQSFTGANTFSNAGNAFTGDGSALTNLNATNVASGTLNDGRLSSNVALLNRAGQSFTGDNSFAPTANGAGTTVKQTSGTATSGSVLDVQTQNGTSHFLQITNAAANEGAVTLQSVGATRDLTLNSGSGTIKIPSSTTGIQNTGSTSFTIDVQNGSNSTLFISNSSTGLASLDVEGGINIGASQTYKINNVQISSTALSNDSDIAKLSGTGPQIFTGNNKFTGTVLLKSSSASAFQIQQTSTSTNLFAVDTSANTVSVGAPTIFNGGTYSSGSSSTITQSLLDNNTTVQVQATTSGLTFTMPTPTVTTLGRLAYITNTGANALVLNYGTGSLNLAVNSTLTLLWNGSNWTGAGSDASTLQNVYTNSTGSTTPEIKLDATRNGLDVQDADSTLGSGLSLFTVRASNGSGLGSSLFNILGNGKVGINIGSTSTSPTISNDLSFGQIAGVTTARTVGVEAQTSSNIGGNGLSLSAGTANGTGAGGILLLQGGTGGAGAAAAGGIVNIFGGNANGTGVSNGGNVVISGGTKAGSGTGGSVIVKPQASNDSTTAFQVQNAGGISLLSIDTTNSVVTIAGTTSTFVNLTLSEAHFKSIQTNAPTIGTPAACGGGTPSATITAGSTDSAGSITINTGSGSPTTCATIITFNKAYGAAPKSVIISSKNSSAELADPYVSATSTTTFTVSEANNSAGDTMQFYYWVIE